EVPRPRPPAPASRARSRCRIRWQLDAGNDATSINAGADAELRSAVIAGVQLLAHIGQADTTAKTGLQAGAVVDYRNPKPCFGRLRSHCHRDLAGSRLDPMFDRVL